MQAVQGPPPGQPVLQAVAPVLAQIEQHDIDQEGQERPSDEGRDQLFEGRRDIAFEPEIAVDRRPDRGQQQKDDCRHDAEAMHQRVDDIGAHRMPLGPALDRPPQFERPEQHIGERDLKPAEHREFDAVERFFRPVHQAELVKHRLDCPFEEHPLCLFDQPKQPVDHRSKPTLAGQ